MDILWESLWQNNVSKKHRSYSYQTCWLWKQKYDRLFGSMLNIQDGMCHIFILRELNFHTNSQCSRMCKGRVNTMHHPRLPWRPWSLYDNRIPTIAVKTLIPAWSKKIITHNCSEESDCDDRQLSEEMLCSRASLQGRTWVSLFITTAAR